MNYTKIKRAVQSLKYIRSNIASHKGIYPFYASFKVTNDCNLTCACCDVWKEKNNDILSTREVHRVMENLSESSVFALCYEGGEPLLRNDIEEIVKFGYRMPYITSMVTSGVNFPLLDICCKYLDFLQISIDEFHQNESLLNELEKFKKRWNVRLTVQIVVSDNTLQTLEEKVKKIYNAGVKVCIMPAARLHLAENLYPDPWEFRMVILELRKKYPHTIITANSFLESINKPGGCSTSSIIIDSDGGLFYPCRTLKDKSFNLLEAPLMQFLKSPKAEAQRRRMASCKISCGWYQYFAVSFLSWRTFGVEICDLLGRVI